MKGIFRNSSIFVQLLLLFSIACIGLMIASWIVSFFIRVKFGLSSGDTGDFEMILFNSPGLLRSVQFFQTLGLFLFPSIVCAWLFDEDYKSYLQVEAPIDFFLFALTLLSILVAIPFLNEIYALNRQMIFPDWLKDLEVWMSEMEKSQSAIQEKMLQAGHWSDLILIILVLCVFTGIGEEFIFRGVLQNIFRKSVKNPHVVIWIVAALFSLVHFQFFGFIPRLLLGAYLGYLIYYTKNIWIPVFAHFTNNCFTVVSACIFQDSPEKMEEIDRFGSDSTIWAAIISLALFSLVFWEIRRRCLRSN
jgi:membrane protease YdiL (CAAX protease family)